MIEKIKNNGGKQPLYVGQTNNIRRRTSEHLRGNDQAIDRKLAKINPDKIAVKYEKKGASNARKNEHKYIKCIEEKIGKRLPFNKIKGIAMKANKRGKAKVKKRKTEKTKKTSTKAKNRKNYTKKGKRSTR